MAEDSVHAAARWNQNRLDRVQPARPGGRGAVASLWGRRGQSRTATWRPDATQLPRSLSRLPGHAAGCAARSEATGPATATRRTSGGGRSAAHVHASLVTGATRFELGEIARPVSKTLPGGDHRPRSARRGTDRPRPDLSGQRRIGQPAGHARDAAGRHGRRKPPSHTPWRCFWSGRERARGSSATCRSPARSTSSRCRSSTD